MKTLEELFSSLQSEKDIFQKSRIIRQLRLDYEVPSVEIAKKLSLHPSYVAHYLRLLSLPDIVIDGYYAKQVSASHLFILARLKIKDEIMQAYKEILERSYTSAQTEELIREKRFKLTGEDADYLTEADAAIISDIKARYPNLKIKLVQTRVQASITLSIKGKRKITTETLKKLLQALAGFEEDEQYDESQHMIYLDEAV